MGVTQDRHALKDIVFTRHCTTVSGYININAKRKIAFNNLPFAANFNGVNDDVVTMTAGNTAAVAA